MLHIENHASDHCMLFLDSNPERKRIKKRFFFDSRWTQYPDIEKVIKTAWNKQIDGSRGFKVTRKVKECRIALSKWSKEIKINNKKEIDRLKKEIREVKNSTRMDKHYKLAGLKSQLAEEYKREEVYWAQKLGSIGSKREIKIQYFSTHV